MKCFNCQQDGHVASDCRWENDLAGETLLAQYMRCTCRKIIYRWDHGLPCDRHRVVTEWQDKYHHTDIYAPSPRNALQPGEDEYRRRAEEQVAESRARRTVLP